MANPRNERTCLARIAQGCQLFRTGDYSHSADRAYFGHMTGNTELTNMGIQTSELPTIRPEDGYNFSQADLSFDVNLETDHVRSLFDSTRLSSIHKRRTVSECVCTPSFPSELEASVTLHLAVTYMSRALQEREEPLKMSKSYPAAANGHDVY